LIELRRFIDFLNALMSPVCNPAMAPAENNPEAGTALAVHPVIGLLDSFYLYPALMTCKPRVKINWYQLGLGLTFSLQLQEWRVARLAAKVGEIGLTYHMGQQCTLFHSSFLPQACQLVYKRYWSQDLSVSVAIYKNQEFNL
jgi:hypothetical protein